MRVVKINSRIAASFTLVLLLFISHYIHLNAQGRASLVKGIVQSNTGEPLAGVTVTPVNPANVDLDYILVERAREVYGEEWRHITLRRMGKLLERVWKYNNNPIYPTCNIKDYHILFQFLNLRLI